MKKNLRNLLVLAFAFIFVLGLAGCNSSDNSSTSDNSDGVVDNNVDNGSVDNNDETSDSDLAQNPIATITMEDGSVIKVELYPEIAPNTVNNFISLASSGFYDGLIFHRVIKNFMIQGGDPNGTGTGGPNYSIKGEFTSNGFKNDLKHTEGVISMARSTAKDSAGSQFFIMAVTYPSLDGEYASFGKVIEGLDVVHQIENVSTNYEDKPLTVQRMKSITIETFGVDYPEPNKVK